MECLFFNHTKNKIYSERHKIYRRYLTIKRISTNRDRSTNEKKAFPHFFLLKASVTVEASFILPLLLYAWVLFISLIAMTGVKERIQFAMTSTAREMAVEAYEHETYVKASWLLRMQKAFNDIDMMGTSICGGIGGINIVKSKILDGDAWIHLEVTYRLHPICPVFNLSDVPVKQRIKLRAWKGYDGKEDFLGADTENADTVYVAENGIVYHTDRMCTHIRLKIYNVTLERTAGYPPCEICGDKGKNTFYITENGICYHNSLFCSGLKRTVNEVNQSAARQKGLKPCSRCSGN